MQCLMIAAYISQV